MFGFHSIVQYINRLCMYKVCIWLVNFVFLRTSYVIMSSDNDEIIVMFRILLCKPVDICLYAV